ncbi:MAG TPA: hypothetical protein VMI12_05580 [Puia sp.]|nr:hypothetical protein [Puia sp.]
MKRIVRQILLLIPAVVLTLSGTFAKTINSSDFSSFTHLVPDTTLLNNLNSGASAIVLRGSLVNFNAAYGKNYFDLNWNAVAEQNCDHFEIERSLDGERFEKVGEVKRNEAISPDENYNFRDNVRPTVARNYDLYYRLKQVDANGDFTYSKVLIARMYNTKTLAALSVTPDPVLNDILVNVQLKMRSYIVIKLTDDNGNLLIKKTMRASEEFNTYKLDDTHELKPGMYSLEVIVNSNERLQMKLLKS